MKRALMILGLFWAFVSNATAGELKLVSNGKSGYQIVVPAKFANANVARLSAIPAKLLQNCLKESTGVLLPIIKEDKLDKSKPAIFLGRTDFAKAHGIDTDKLKGWTYVEKIVGENIILAGNDHPDVLGEKSASPCRYILGTLKAVTSFLKRIAEVKFLLPGPNGIEVPKRASISVPGNLNIKVEPYLNFSSGRRSEIVYDVANNYFQVNSFKSNGGHSFYVAVPKKKYVKTHPEYFALLAGKRNANSNHLCISNPEVFELMYKDILRKLDQGYTTYEIGQTDGYKPCECEKCAKLYGVSDPGEKIWILQRKLAERLMKDRPGKKVAIISYGPTAEPPKTFHEFPPNVMIELANSSEESFDKWKKYKVPGGFTTYIYNWGGYQQAGLTPKSTPFSVSKQVDRFIKNGVKGIYKCGWGELFGLEGPVYYVYGRLFDNTGEDYRRISDEFYKCAYGKAYIPMKIFFDTLYGRLELYANYLSAHCEAQKFAPSNPKPVLAYNYSPEVLDTLEKSLGRAEKMADTPKVKLRVALVRKEFDYVKNLAMIIHCYNFYKIAPDKQSFDKLAALIEKRNKMLDSYFDPKGRMRKIPGWDVRFLGRFDKNMLKVNGRLRAPISSPLTWDVANLKKRGILPGTLKKKYIMYKTTETVPLDGNFEKGPWKNIPFEPMGGIQMGKTREYTKFKMLYDADNLYIGFIFCFYLNLL